MASHPHLTAEFTLQSNDVYDPFRWTWGNIARWVITLFACFVAYDTRRFWLPAMSGPGAWAGLLLALLLVGLLLFALFFRPWLRTRAMFREFPMLRKPYRVSFGPEGMHFESEGFQSEYEWSAFNRIVETPEMFILTRATRSHAWIPKRCLRKPSELLILRQLIRENFKGRSTLRRD
jgi:hypothetical protein